MVKRSDIKQRTELDENGDTAIITELSLRTRSDISKDVMESLNSGKIYQDRKAYGVKQVYEFIYGDLYKPLRELQAMCLKSCDPVIATEMANRFDEVFVMMGGE